MDEEFEREHEEQQEPSAASVLPQRFRHASRPGRMDRASEVSSVLSGAVRKARGALGVAADWVEENPIATLVFAGAALFFVGRRKACVPVAAVTGPRYVTSGVWADLAAQTGRQSDPPWLPSGMDLDVKTAQLYLNRVAGARLRVDGILGPKTAAALRHFQSHNGIFPSGTMDAETSGALEYLYFASSPNPKLKEAAAMSPESIARLGSVTYTPYPMPSSVPYAPSATPYYSAEVPPELASAVRYYQALSAAPPVLGPRTGIQSISMSDVRDHYDVPGHFEDWGPGPGGSWG